MVAGVVLLIAALVIFFEASGCTNRKSPASREPYLGTTSASAVNGVQDVTLTVDSSFRFTPSTIVVHRGLVRIILRHIGTGAPHNWSLVGFPADFVPNVEPGETASAEFMAPSPGTYTFECTIHLRQGQTGTLVVLPD
jgi:plastocyanin